MIKKIALFLLLAVLVAVAPVSAHDTPSGEAHEHENERTATTANTQAQKRGDREGLENLRQAREEMASGEIRAARNDAKCAVVTAYINGRLTHYDERKRAYVERHQKMTDRVKALIVKLEEKGYDVTEVRDDLTKLTGLIDTAEADFQTFIAKLEATKQYDCADANGAFLTSFKDAQAALKTFREDLKAIRDFVTNTLRPHLKALKDQDPASATQQLRARPSTNDDATR